jgi:tetratricopeptide (TPR) repeat protein
VNKFLLESVLGSVLKVEAEVMFDVLDDTRLSMAGFRRATTTALFLSAALVGTAALAAGGGGGAGSGAAGGASGGGAVRTNSGADLTTCDKGQVWDAKNKKCIIKKSGVLPDRDLTEYAYALAKAQRFQEALDVLDALQDPNTPRALNYRGYATRKLGHTEEGINYYLKSVALDPTYTQVREYLGEAYVTLGKFDLANEQLATIQRLCGGRECEEYEDLSDAINKGKIE